MLNRWFGWLSSPEPVAGSSDVVSSNMSVGCEESSDEEALLGTLPVPQANMPAQSCSPCVHTGDEVSTRELLGDSSGNNWQLGNQQDGTAWWQCLFAELSERTHVNAHVK